MYAGPRQDSRRPENGQGVCTTYEVEAVTGVPREEAAPISTTAIVGRVREAMERACLSYL